MLKMTSLGYGNNYKLFGTSKTIDEWIKIKYTLQPVRHIWFLNDEFIDESVHSLVIE